VFGTDAIGASGVYLGATYSGPPAPPLGWKLFCYSNAAATGSQNFSAGEWHHIVYALNGSNITFFIDGIAYPVLATGRALATTATASIGWCVNPNQFWNGSLDEVAIYPRALTAPEIAAHYALASAPAVDPAAADIPYRQLLLQAAGAPAYVGPLASVSAATGQPISTTAPTSLGPYATGPVKLSDLYAVGAGATLNLLGVPF
jgi:hypothetical protein